jgi:hypothetical protein
MICLLHVELAASTRKNVTLQGNQADTSGGKNDPLHLLPDPAGRTVAPVA